MFSFLRREPGFYKQTVALAIPIMLQNLITNSMGLLDTFMVGLMGELPLAGVTLANIPTFVITFVLFGIQSGSSILISQNWGKKDMDAINRVLGIGLYCAGAVTLLFSLVTFFFPHSFMSLFGNDPEVVEVAARYIRIVGFSFLADSFAQVYIAAHRAMENPRLGLYILGVSVVTNTFLNWVLIFGHLGAPAMGVEGAALATLLARCIGLVITIVHAFAGRRLKFHFRSVLMPGRVMVKQFFRYATPVTFNETAWGLGSSLYTTIMGHMDGSKEILAAYAIAGNIERVFTVAIFAVAAAAAIIVGREIGAGRRETVYDVGACLNFLATVVGAALSVVLLFALYFVFIPYLYPIFGLSETAARITTIMLTIIFATLSLRSFIVTCIVGVLRGGGDVRAATIIDLVPLWCFALPLTAIVALVLRMDFIWVYLCVTTENLIKFYFMLKRFRSGEWIHDLTIVSYQKEK